MADNVFILGAGFSFNAGIPLMGAFVEAMWKIAVRRRSPLSGGQLDEKDQDLLNQATALIADLDSYHGRANFDDRNIEDLLSILSFDQLSGGRKSKASLEKITKAIAKTIELTCTVQNRNLIQSPKNTANDPETFYQMFWSALFNIYGKHKVTPTLITFNYDLVLERTLVELMTGSRFSGQRQSNTLPFDSFAIDYFSGNHISPAYQITPTRYSGQAFTDVSGTKLVSLEDATKAKFRIPLLKLHGSLNFPTTQRQILQLEKAVDDPQILPPLFNKNTAALSSSSWARALMELREAKNIVIVGYSLPKTDIYMQYFLRAALGPNVNLNQITVYDPSLFGANPVGVSLRQRYQECFSPQLQQRIAFEPAAKKITQTFFLAPQNTSYEI